MAKNRGKKAGIMLLTASVLALGSGTAVASWTVTDLSTWQGVSGDSIASGINNSGQVVGATNTGYPITQATLWANGAATTLTPLPGGIGGWAQTINDAGLIGGSSRIGTLHATLWSNSGSGYVAQEIFTPSVIEADGLLYGSDDTGVGGMNSAGTVVGQAIGSYAPAQAYIYGNGAISALAAIGVGTNCAYDINNNGQIVGYSQPNYNSMAQPVLWQNAGAAPQILQNLSPLIEENIAMAINDLGQIVGMSRAVDEYGITRAALWSTDGSGVLLPSLVAGTGNYTQAGDINNAGVAVGYSSAADGKKHAVMWKDGQIIDLNILVTSDLTLEEATAINDLGQIVGSAINSNGRQVAFLLSPDATPTPIPGALPLFASGLAGLRFIRRRKSA